MNRALTLDDVRVLAQRGVNAAVAAKAAADKATHEALSGRRVADEADARSLANSVAIRESADRCAESFGKVASELGEVRDTLQTILELLMRERGQVST